jgi:allantoinase
VSSLLIRGGIVVEESGTRQADVLVRNGRIEATFEPDTRPTADRVLDARGLHVLPGLVDAHVHFNEPGRTHWEGFLTGTSAAAAGGVTTVVDMPLNCDPPTLDLESLRLKQSAVSDQAVVDYALWGGVVPASIESLAELQRAGVVGVKAFLCDSGLAEYPPLDEVALEAAMRRCAKLGLLLALHAEDHAETDRLGSAARAEGRLGPLDWARSRPVATEVRPVSQALELAQRFGTRVHFVHVSTGEAAVIGARAREEADVSVETCPHYLALDEQDLQRLGPAGKCAPPLRSSDVQEQLWMALCDGDLDFVASDHSPCPPELKQTDDIWQAWGGISGVQTLLPVLLTEGVHARGLPLERLVTMTSAAPARRLGLYPRKGSLAPGSDADLVFVDLERQWTLRSDQLLYRWKISPFEGRQLRGAVAATLVRGEVVYRNGMIEQEPGYGRLVLPA